jgi:hypothetical protein
VGLRTGLDDVEKIKSFTPLVLELRPLSRLARSQSLYRLSYPGLILRYSRLRVNVRIFKCKKPMNPVVSTEVEMYIQVFFFKIWISLESGYRISRRTVLPPSSVASKPMLFRKVCNHIPD